MDEVAVSWAQLDGFDGADVIFPDGYAAVFAPLAAQLDIRLNTINSRQQVSALLLIKICYKPITWW
ncbi:hypothetical protein [Neisseria iguanae]|uniref:Uncharacterized protein n=1 Tax=Neisseria iguanae TaxID=90242 RepID=A0A2P7TY19_9NEIS|nr:hypothetical protein [Neisseria iguanae]PSJ79595.1 hypothetical protein C7N83_11195 [Neisseria iguanae]